MLTLCCGCGCAIIRFPRLCGTTVAVTKDGINYPVTNVDSSWQQTGLVSAGTYTWTTTGTNSCVVGQSGTVVVDCSVGTVTVSLTVTPAAGYHVDDDYCAYLCCTMPDCINVAVSHPLLNAEILRNCTLQWTTPPSGLGGLGLTNPGYFSTTSFIDAETGDTYWYYLACFLNYMLLTRVYAVSVYGSPFRDVVRYQWLVSGSCEISSGGGPSVFDQNTCCPFRMVCGSIFAGGDATCRVNLEECS
jgi:hypothetical protein